MHCGPHNVQHSGDFIPLIFFMQHWAAFKTARFLTLYLVLIIHSWKQLILVVIRSKNSLIKEVKVLSVHVVGAVSGSGAWMTWVWNIAHVMKRGHCYKNLVFVPVSVIGCECSWCFLLPSTYGWLKTLTSFLSVLWLATLSEQKVYIEPLRIRGLTGTAPSRVQLLNSWHWNLYLYSHSDNNWPF